ncbi:MAG: HipA N-terminal domain-containing protein [Anaerolineales bacterium]
MKGGQNRAAVYFQEMRAGTLTKTDDGYEFEYDPDYLSDPDARQISLSLPLRQEKYESTQLFSFFDGLLPEGWLLDIISSTAKIDKKNKFQLLLLTGKDPIGAVSIIPDEKAS